LTLLTISLRIYLTYYLSILSLIYSSKLCRADSHSSEIKALPLSLRFGIIVLREG